MSQATISSTSLQPFIGLAPACPSLSFTGHPRPGHTTPDVLSAWLRRITTLTYWWSSNAGQLLLAAFATRANFWLTFHSVSTRCPAASSVKLLSSQSDPSLFIGVPGVSFLPRGRAWHLFSFIRVWRFPLAHFSNLSRSHLMAVQLPGVSITSHA